MMREHMGLYRGKRKDNGEWVEGSLLKVTLNGKTAHLIFGDNFSFVGNDVRALSHALVDPDTVGECTGLRDKNGKLIFEGDIVEGCDFTVEDGGFGVIDFDDGAFTVSGNNIEGTFHENYWGQDLEIIGNVHDNPELLKGGEGDG